MRTALLIVLLYALLGAALIFALYGCASVVLGEKQEGFTNTIYTFPMEKP